MTYRRRPRYDMLIWAVYCIIDHFIERLFCYGWIFFSQNQKKQAGWIDPAGKKQS